MTATTLIDDDRRGVSTNFRRRFARHAYVANLPALLRSDLDQHLPFYDRAALLRLAPLASRCCRNQGQGSFGKDAK